MGVDNRTGGSRWGWAELNQARAELTTRADGLGAVSVGTPHMSLTEMVELADMVDSRSTRVPFYVNTGRDVLEEANSRGVTEHLDEFGATIVTDTCTYITPIMAEVSGSVMTNSAKWAHYAPANLGVEVVFSSLTDCVRSAIAGEVITTQEWH